MLELQSRSDRQHCDIVFKSHSAKVEFRYHGFWPGLDFQECVERQVRQLRRRQPTLQELRGRIEREGSGYRMLILSTTAEGSTIVEDLGLGTKKTAKRAFEQLLLRFNIKLPL